MKFSSNCLSGIFFSVPILIGALLGMLFPFVALKTMKFSLVLLAILIFYAGLSIDFKKIKITMFKKLEWICISLFLTVLVIPAFFLIPAVLFVQSTALIIGLAFAALNPVAIVAPYFCQKNSLNSEIAYILVFATMLLTPIYIPVFLKISLGDLFFLELSPLVKTVLVISILPIALSVLISWFLPKLKHSLKKTDSFVNQMCLTGIVFLVMGSTMNRFTFNLISISDFTVIVLLMLALDFGVLFGIFYILRMFVDVEDARSIAISMSMKNMAISSSLLLFLYPAAVLPSAIGFFVHMLLFGYLSMGTFGNKNT